MNPDRPVTLLHHLFEQSADRTPNAVALICRDTSLTFADVERQSNRLAHLLRSKGAGPGRFVGVYLGRSERAIVALLAVLKSGAAYVPLDPVYPPDRIQHILGDADVRWLISEAPHAAAARTWPTALDVIALDEASTRADLGRARADRLSVSETGVVPTDLCYVMYTSGTTGRPKGIMTEHHNVIAFTRSFQDICSIKANDRVYQGFSLGFDGSVEEYVLAFAAGAPLVVGPPELAQHGDDTADYMTAHGVTYFSTVPTFLRLITKDVPSLRLLVVSGEPCPPDLIAQWTRPMRRMLNVYGPTEATVNTTSWDCEPDRVVSIGRPLDGYLAYVLDEHREPVTTGAGELYVGGVGVARGYLNQPELTAETFVADPFVGGGARMYKTGDLVQRNDAGELQFLGRTDGQVKVRGFRIELAEIESVLRECDGIEAAVATTVARDGQPHIAAFVVSRQLDRRRVREHLRHRLPPYMVPTFLDTLAALPRLASGKADRRSLPLPQTRLVDHGRTIVGPRDDAERQLAAIWEELFATAPVSTADDFFLDLGGDSLVATTLVNLLRARHGRTVSLRDVYEHSTIAELAPAMRTEVAPASAETPHAPHTAAAVFARTPRWERGIAVSLQFIGAAALYGLIALLPFAISVIASSVVRGARTMTFGVTATVLLVVVSYPAWLAFTIALKWVLVGRYRTGEWSMYGISYVRFWLARRVQSISGVSMLAGTPAMNWYYRLMGARIGRGCILDTSLAGAFDLLTIGDESSIGAETQLLGFEIRGGLFRVAPVTLGHRCFVGAHSALGLNVRMQDDAKLGDLSMLANDTTMPEGACWRGSPATPGPVPIPAMGLVEQQPSNAAAPFGYLLLATLLDVMLLAVLVPGAALVWWSRGHGWLWKSSAIATSVPVSVVSCCLVFAVVVRLLVRNDDAGTYRVGSWRFVRRWCADAVTAMGRTYLRPLYTTIYIAPWLRMLGARIGRLAEISTISQAAPDLLHIGDQSFFADGSMVGGRRFYRGCIQMAHTRIGRRSFVGNSAILSVGTHLGSDGLLGVLSTPPDNVETTADGTEWLGSPSFALPHRRKVQGFDASVTFEPARHLYAYRLFVDAVRILVPGFLAVMAALAAYLFTVEMRAHTTWLVTLSVLPFASMAIAALVVVIVAAVKTIVMGRFTPVVKPLWCGYVWWNEMVNGAWESASVAALLPIIGSPLFNTALRLMGCRIGRASSINTTLFSEFDLVSIGSFSALNDGVVVQNHLFEDRIMKSSYVSIGDECSVGNMAVVLYDSDVQSAASLASLSLIMKGSVVPAGASWIGIPASAVQNLREDVSCVA